MNLFLQAAYKIQPDDVKTCYDVSKDFIVPILGPALGVIGAYIVMRLQMNRHETKEKTDKLKQRKLELEMLKINNEKTILNNKHVLGEVNKLINDANLNNFSFIKINKFNSTFYIAIHDLGYQKIFEFLDLKKTEEINLFVKYWSAISNIPQTYIEFNEFLMYIVKENNKYNALLADANESLAIQIKKNIHDQVPTNEPIEYTKEELNSDPKLKLAAISYTIEQDFQNSKLPIFEKFKKLHKDLNKIFEDPIASMVRNIDFDSNLQKAESHVTALENIQKSYKETLNSYKTAYLDYSTIIENFGALLSKKTL